MERMNRRTVRRFQTHRQTETVRKKQTLCVKTEREKE